MANRLTAWDISARGFLSELGGDLKLWLAERGLWWGTSVVVHALILSAMLLLLGTFGLEPHVPTDLVALVCQSLETDNQDLIEHIVTPQVDPPPVMQQVDLTSIALSPGDTISPEARASDPGEDTVGVQVGPSDTFLTRPNLPENWIRQHVEGPGPGPGTGPGRSGVPGPYRLRTGGRGGGKVVGIAGMTKTSDRAVGQARALDCAPSEPRRQLEPARVCRSL